MKISSVNVVLFRIRLTYIIFSIIKFEATKYHTNKRKADGAVSGGSSAKKAKVSKKSNVEAKTGDDEQQQDPDHDLDLDQEDLDQELLDQASSESGSRTKPKSKASTAKKAPAALSKAKPKATASKKTPAKSAAKSSTANKAFKPPALKPKVTKPTTPPPQEEEEANEQDEFEGPSDEDLEDVQDKPVKDSGGDIDTENISKVLDDIKASASNTAPKGFEFVGVQAVSGLRKEARPTSAQHSSDLGKAGLKAYTAPSASVTPRKEVPSTTNTSSPAVAAAEVIQVEDDADQVLEEIANSIEIDHDTSSVVEERPRIRRLTDSADATKVHRSIFDTRTDTPTEVQHQPLAQPIFTPTPKFTNHINNSNTISISVTLLSGQVEGTSKGTSYIMALPSSVSFAEVLGKYMLQLPQGHADYWALADADKCVLRTADGNQQNFSIREAYVEKMWKAAVGRALREPEAESGMDVLEVEIS